MHHPDRSPTLVHRLTSLAAAQPDALAYRFLVTGDVDGPVETVTWSELHGRASALGQLLAQEGLRGERALLLYPPGLDYVTAFLGCLYGGVTAVPAYPPDPTRLERTLPRLRALVRDCDAKVALTLAPIKALAVGMTGLAPELGAMGWVATDRFRDVVRDDVAVGDIVPDGLAFLQYTSGSTGDPRGVMVRHSNLMANGAMIQEAFGFPPGAVNITWLPPYHDMGLIGGILQTVYAGVTGVLMAPMAFLQKPVRWLQAISRLGGVRTISGGPNFAYDLCARKVSEADKAGLDLSGWRLAFNGAEPVRRHTLDRFAEAFAGCGFDPRAAFPCYGLAEVTLFASGGPRAELPATVCVDEVALARLRVELAPEGYPLVSSGALAVGQELRVVEPETRRVVASGEVGELWVRGGHVAGGYWGRPEETAQTFGATLAETGEGPYLRTGDLGFVREGEVFVTGRSKDVVVIRGRNLWPDDVERTVELCHPSVRPGCVAAFAVSDGTREGLGVLAEVRDGAPGALEAVARAIQHAVAAEHGVAVSDLTLTAAGRLPKTSSGKVQRSASRAAAAKGEVPELLRAKLGQAEAPAVEPGADAAARTPTMSLMFFSANDVREGEHVDFYGLFLEASRRADRLGFEAVWIPERHFHPFGALFPNPATLAAALATSTQRIGIRAGSVVMPLHDPVRVAEEWAVVDRLSGGRTGIAFASGWNPNDFTLAPSRYADRHRLMWEGIETTRGLWRGDAVVRDNGVGEPSSVRIFPRPAAEPPLWITCTGAEERFVEAGRAGFHVLTALLFQTPEELAGHVAAYRRARAEAGLDPAAGRVTVMLHTFVGDTEAAVEAAVAAPLRQYLACSVDLWRQSAASLDALDEAEREAVLGYAARRYLERSALIGTPASCAEMLDRVRAAGVDEVACLIDFGVERAAVLEGLEALDRLRRGDVAPRIAEPAVAAVEAPVSARAEALRAMVLEAAERLLERSLPEGASTVLQAAGVDSLLAVELSQALGERLGLALPATIWFDHPSIAAVAAELERVEAGDVGPAAPRFDLLADAVLPDDIGAGGKPVALTSAPRCVLLTGVTGFLGAFLLKELMAQTTAHILCLVRARDVASGEALVRATLTEYGLWEPTVTERVTVIPGDLGEPRFGLDEAGFGALAERVDAIHHNGALVNFAYAYETCRAPNVLGTLWILRLACHGSRVVPVHYVSTIAVYSHAYAGRVVAPQDVPEDHTRLDMGYSRSKWVAERLVMAARERGMPIAVYRAGLITGATETGVCHLTNYVWNLIRVSIEIGELPDYDRVLDMIPVDWAARSIVRTSLTEGEHNAVLHVTNRHPTSLFKIRDWLESRGYPMRLAPFDRWQVQVMQRVCASPSLSALLPVLALAAADFYARRQVRYDSDVASAPFERAGDPCPPADEHLLDNTLRFYVEAGFMPSPGQCITLEAGPEQLLRGQRLHEMVAEITGVSREFVEETYERSPALRSIHPLGALEPDECQWLISCEGASLINAVMAHAPRYVEWMMKADMTAAYRFHRSAVQTLLWRRPGGRLVCKDPWHLWHLDALLAVYPTSKVILIHRDMAEVVPSLCSLSRELQRVEATPVSDEVVGRYALDLLERGVRRAEAARRSSPDSFIDVEYRALVAEPIGTVREIYGQLGRPLTPAAEAAMLAWLAANPSNKHGKHRYSLEMFGLTEAEVAERFAQVGAAHVGAEEAGGVPVT